MKKNWKLACMAIMMIAAVGLFLACGDDSPTSPSVEYTSPQQTTSMVPPSTTNNPTNPPTTPPTYVANITNGNNGTAKGTVTNNNSRDEDIVFVCYEDPNRDINTQKVLDEEYYPWHYVNLDSGQSMTFKIELPKNEDGDVCAVQCDVARERHKPRVPPFYTEEELLAFAEYGTGICVPPPCTGDCGDDECVKPSRPEGNCEWLPSLCKWSCECSPCQSEVKASINVSEDRRGNIIVSGNTPYPGVVTMPDGSTTNVRKGRFSLNAGMAECEETYTASIKTYDGQCGGEPVPCSPARDSYTANDCSCNTCQHTRLSVTKNGRGDGIQVSNPPSGTYYTVGDDPTPHYSAGNHGPYEAECEETITVVVKLYDESCGDPAVFCRDWSITFTGNCLCEGVDLSGSSSIDGNNLVTASVNDAPGSSATHYKYKRHNMSNASTTTMPWSEDFQLSCDGSYQVTVRAYDGEKQCDEKVLTEDASGCSQCVLPGSGSGELDLPNSNPTTECGHFNLIPGNGGFYITKCGQFYQWGTSHPPPDGQCTNQQDVSHITECECLPDPS